MVMKLPVEHTLGWLACAGGGLRGNHCRLTVGALSMIIATIQLDCFGGRLNIIIGYAKFNCIVLLNFYLPK
jgi:hypothetical protein